jgi:hypothetical protein
MFGFLKKGDRIASVALAAGFCAGLLGLTVEARATALYTSTANASLTIVGVVNDTTPGDLTGLSIQGGVEIGSCFCGPALFVEGNATGFATPSGAPQFLPPDYDPVTLGIGDVLSMSLATGGSANPVGYTEAGLDGFAVIFFENTSSTDSYTVTLTLSYSLITAASIDDAVMEDAVGDASLLAYSFNDPSDIADEYSEADALFGIFTGPVVNSITFSLALGPNGFDIVEVDLLAGGFAEALPEAGTLFVMLAGLAALSGIRRRR